MMSDIDIIKSIRNIDNEIYNANINIMDSRLNIINKQSMICEYAIPSQQYDQFDIFCEEAEHAVSYNSFDNKCIIDAINLINKAREETASEKENENTNNVNIGRIVHSADWKTAIEKLNTQFNCHIHISYILGIYLGATSTIPAPLSLRQVYISKSKGFQLDGAHMLINVGEDMAPYVPKDKGLFGQFMVSIICHEIFHNIAALLRMRGNDITTMTAATVQALNKTPGVKQKRIIIQNYINSLDGLFGVKLDNRNKKRVIKKLLCDVTIGDAMSDDLSNNDSSFEVSDVTPEEIKKYKKDWVKQLILRKNTV